MPYKHDVFISYRRDVKRTPWTREHFKELLQAYLLDDLGRKAEIFIDERIEVGADWVDGLGENLAKSKVLVALLSRSYFGSDWCVHELDLIFERARQLKGSFLPEARLIIPVVVHDGEQIPNEIARLQKADISKYWVAELNTKAPDYPEFSNAIKRLSPAVAEAVEAVETGPAFDDSWIACCKKRFGEVYEASEKGTRLAPTQFALKAAPLPTVLPQMKP